MYQITVCAVLAAILFAAIYAFIKTPPAERWVRREKAEEIGADYAPLYTIKERFILLLKNALWLTPLLLIFKFWFSPHLKTYIPEAHCHNYGPINGIHLVFYGYFVGMPLCFALILFFLEGLQCIKVFKLAQYPLPHKKVFARTKYKFGRSARLHALTIFSVIVLLIGLSVWGGFQAHKLTAKIPSCTPEAVF